jgi:hypothetical protein
MSQGVLRQIQNGERTQDLYSLWRKVWGVTFPGKPASPTALLKLFLTDATGLPPAPADRSYQAGFR